MEPFCKICETFCTYPVIQILCAIEFAGFVRIGFFPAEFAVFMPKVLDFFTFQVFMPSVCFLDMLFGIAFDFLEKSIFIFVRNFPKFWECNLVKSFIG